MQVCFRAHDYTAEDRLVPADYAFTGSAEEGWAIERNGAPLLDLGPGYRLLRTEQCGVCSTDLARRFLPFPLPQVTGHEVVAVGEDNRRCVVEINASHQARGVDTTCPYCNAGLGKHCPARLVLGIHDLPGGFGPWLLAPKAGVLEIPVGVPIKNAVLVEPFAAALNAVTTVAPRTGETVAVLGPRRLGLLVVAALAAQREQTGAEFDILALSRHERLLDLAHALGATETVLVRGDGDGLDGELAEVVIDTTGNPDALGLALRLARREVHVKSTHGQPAGGLRHVTEMVVDELRLGLAGGNAGGVIVDSLAEVDRAIRPRDDSEASAVPPRSSILLRSDCDDPAPLARAIVERGLTVSTSRCGDFREALALMESSPALQGLGERMITHEFDAADIAEAFAIARSPECIKAVVRHRQP